MDNNSGENKDQIAEGIKWTLITLFSGGVASISPHPGIKLVALVAAAISGTNAVNCYKVGAQIAHQQIATSRVKYQLPPA